MGIIVDLFAGGGGASTGIEMALGRSPDIAINHDAKALALHAMNHPETLHLLTDVWDVSPGRIVAEHGPVSLLWASPDCTHFSKAKGGKPVSQKIRGLAWVVPKWGAKARPRVIKLENVEEFQSWGPILKNGRPCPVRRGQTFRQWIAQIERLGYRVEYRELRASDYDAPTIRKRLFVIARRDDEPIVYPMPSNGPRDSLDVRAGSQRPYRVAADIIDWSIPCPSIFLDRSEAKEFGVRRPLADATLRRIAKGVMRYVVNNPKPFIVTLNHGGENQRAWALDEPFRTVTASRDAHALVAPIVTRAQHGGGNRAADDPLHTVCASTKDQNAIIAPTLIPRYGERPGQEPRARDISEPLATVVPTGNGAQVVAAFLAQHNGPGGGRAGQVGNSGHQPDKPLSTIVGKGPTQGVVTAHMMPHYGASVARDADAPVGTVTAGGGGKQAVVATHMLSMKGSDRRSRPADEPANTVCAKGNHAAVVAAFLTKYYGTNQDPKLDAPLHTVSTKDRFSLVTVTINDEEYVIVDIGMRMLTPRELYRAQGFPESYVIDETEDGPLTKADQTRMCGNSVCPPVAKALVEANCDWLRDVEVDAA